MTIDDEAVPAEPAAPVTTLGGEPPAAPMARADDLASAAAERAAFGHLPIEALADVELKVEVILGRARLRLQELLDVRPGQAIELDRARNSPVDILVNGTLFARGEIVVIDDTNLGVRVSEIVGADPTKEAHA